MDDLTHQAAEGAVHSLPCVFEKALAMGCAACTTSVRGAIAEREAIRCTSLRRVPIARRWRPSRVNDRRSRCVFPRAAPLPHAIAVRLQCGGLNGLRSCVSPDERDVRRLVAAAQAAHGGLADLPWPDIIVAVMVWQGRRSSKRHPA